MPNISNAKRKRSTHTSGTACIYTFDLCTMITDNRTKTKVEIHFSKFVIVPIKNLKERLFYVLLIPKVKIK